MRKEDDVFMDCFLKTGRVGYYLLYKEINNKEE
jgi:hypothetical protein